MAHPSRPRHGALFVGLATAAALAFPGAVSAADRVVTLKGYDEPSTPAKYDVVKVLKQGPSSAKRVLVLEPGTSAGAPNFRVVAKDILKRLPGRQIWSVERRENLLEDHTPLDRVKRGTATPQQLFDYYLGWIGAPPSAVPHFAPKTIAETAFARSWACASRWRTCGS